MKRQEYLENLFNALNEGRISEEAYDAALLNTDVFCDEEDPCLWCGNPSESEDGFCSEYCRQMYYKED